MKKLMALMIALSLVGVSFTPAFADGRRHRDRGHHSDRHHQRPGVSPGLLFGLGALGILGGVLTYESLREREVIDPRVCGYVPGPYVWNPNWQRWESSWVLACR